MLRSTGTFLHPCILSQLTLSQEIHKKITSIGFQDCKVFVHSVDAQSSANGGIIIQVIGELSNHGDPWKKFVQTFFLAEQPNGYFVLNDIFRFLKEESTEDDLSEVDASAAPTEEQPLPEQFVVEPVIPPVSIPEPEPASVSPPTPPPEPTPPPAPLPVEEPTTVNPQSPTPPPAAETKLPEPNGVHSPEPEPSVPSPQISTISVTEVASEPAPEIEATLQPQAPPTTLPAPPSQPPAPIQQQSQPQPQPHAPTPAKPKSWATLAATDSKRWGSAVAQESKGLTEVPVSSGSPAPPPAAHSPAPHGHRGSQHHGPREHPAVTTVQALTTPQCFVKVCCLIHELA